LGTYVGKDEKTVYGEERQKAEWETPKIKGEE
jgi:hypothetical protein